MPRGRKKTIPVVENIDERIAAVEDEIASLTEALKAKKAERKELAKAKLEADKAAALKKAKEEKEAILAAVAASGKTVDEILDMLKK